jgi:hypothetical protein
MCGESPQSASGSKARTCGEVIQSEFEPNIPGCVIDQMIDRAVSQSQPLHCYHPSTLLIDQSRWIIESM